MRADVMSARASWSCMLSSLSWWLRRRRGPARGAGAGWIGEVVQAAMSPFWVNAAEMMVKASWWTRWARASSAGRTVQAREGLHASQHGRQKGRGHQARSRAQQEEVG